MGIKKLVLIALTLGLLTLPATGVFANQPPAAPLLTPTPAADALASLKDYLTTDVKPPLIYAHAYTLIDAANGAEIIGNNELAKQPIASTTKMMTALVARDELKLDEVVAVPRQATLIPGSKINLLAGEQITVRNLLKGLLIQSGNDAAYTLAYTFTGKPGEYAGFVDKMNDKAKEYHLDNTHYGDPAGLDDDNGYSTAHDLAQIGRLILQDEFLVSIVKTGSETITSTNGTISHPLTNSNHLVDGAHPLYLPGVIGIKTGFTPAAGHCLVAAYQTHDRIVIGAILYTNEFSNNASAAEMRKLFFWADQNLKTVKY